MSGAEFLAVVGCVAAVVSAYHNGNEMVEKIKAKRRKRDVPQPTILLEQSLQRGETDVVKAKDDGINRYGSAFANGDDTAIKALKEVEVDLLRAIVDNLAHAQENDKVIDFSVVVDTSDLGRVRALTALHELYMRIAQAEPIQLSRFSSQHAQLEHIPETATEVFATGSPPSEVYPQGGKMQVWLTKWRRRSTSSANERTKNDRDRQLGTLRLNSQDQTEGDPRNRISTSLPLSASPLSQLEEEENPWREIWPALTTNDSPPTSPVSHPPSTRLRPTSQISSGSRPRSERINNSTESLDYCLGANYLQKGFPKDAFKKTNQSVSMQGENYYWRCRNKQCVFHGPAVKKVKEWRFDSDIIRNTGTQNLEYRWSFLAKSHLPLGKVKGGWRQHTFKCFICHLQGNNQSIFEGSRSFLDHTASHAGQYLDNTCIQGPLVLRAELIRNLSDKDSEKFDVNIPPRVETRDTDSISPISEDGPSADFEEKDLCYRPQNDADSGSMNPWLEP